MLVTGEVRTPGKVSLPGTTMSLLEALALAGIADAERQQRSARDARRRRLERRCRHRSR